MIPLLVSTPIAVAFLVLLVALPIALVALCLRRSNRKSVVICPPVEMPCEVELDTAMRLKSCTRLPAGGVCEQYCMPQLEYSPIDLGHFMERHGSRSCANCAKAITADDWYRSRLVGATTKFEAITTDTDDTSDSIICWECYVMRRVPAES